MINSHGTITAACEVSERYRVLTLRSSPKAVARESTSAVLAHDEGAERDTTWTGAGDPSLPGRPLFGAGADGFPARIHQRLGRAISPRRQHGASRGSAEGPRRDEGAAELLERAEGRHGEAAGRRVERHH